MQVMLQDVINYLPLVGGISQAEEVPKLWSLLEYLKPAGQWAAGIFGIIGVHFASEYELIRQNITKADFIPFFMMLMSIPVMMLPSKGGAGNLAFKTMGLEARLKGRIVFFFLGGGILLLALNHLRT